MANSYADAAVKSMKTWERRPADHYATPAAATQGLIDMSPPPKGLVHEPACGDGEIARVLEANGYEVDASDIRHTGYGIGGKDFFNKRAKGGAYFTNPPFSMAAEFIHHALVTLECEYLALLLKSNFWHTKSRLELKRNLHPSGEHPLTWRLAFLEKERGKSPLMDCTWMVWDRRYRVYSEIGISDTRSIGKPLIYPDVSIKPLSVQLVRAGNAMDDMRVSIRDAA